MSILKNSFICIALLLAQALVASAFGQALEGREAMEAIVATIQAQVDEEADVAELTTSRCVFGFPGTPLAPEPVAVDTRVNHSRTWSANPETDLAPTLIAAPKSFPATITLKPLDGEEVASAVVRPLAADAPTEVQDGVVTVTFPSPGNYVVEFNGDPTRAAMLFLVSPNQISDVVELATLRATTESAKFDALEPLPEYYSNVRYYPPGVHNERVIELHSNEFLYLAPGAIVNGSVVARNASDIRIFGRGVICGANYDRYADTLVGINLENCRDCQINGVTILDASAWSLQLYRCHNVRVNNIQIVGARSNSDGISIQSSAQINVHDCFVRSWDDSLVVKGYGDPAEDILFYNMTLWTDLAQSMEIGYETRAPHITKINFRDVTVVHNFHKPVISIHNSDDALVRDVSFQNIVVEDAQMGSGDGVAALMEFTVAPSQWSKRPLAGRISNVLVENLTVLSGRCDLSVRFFSQSPALNIENVSISGLTINGEKLDSWSRVKVDANEFCGPNITLEGRSLVPKTK
ncbi:MAG: glycosyl hydrolase family 28 protein [Planctomycetia bacterium]|nr:glycosyl hydrolase family 28 protein [Planctomycetia bacterium]